MRSGSTFPLLVLLTWVFAALGAPLFSLTPNEVGLQRILEPPGAVAWFGFDDLGRPLFDRLIA